MNFLVGGVSHTDLERLDLTFGTMKLRTKCPTKVPKVLIPPWSFYAKKKKRINPLLPSSKLSRISSVVTSIALYFEQIPAFPCRGQLLLSKCVN
jgi:hypothetical protein